MNGSVQSIGACPEISHHLVRGLRRDLFRQLSDRMGKHWPRLQGRLATAKLPYPSPRDAISAYGRTKAALRDCSFGYREACVPEEGLISASGVVIEPAVRSFDDGGKEDVLELVFFSITVKPGRLEVNAQRCGQIGQHAIERMFKRLETTTKSAVLDELVSSLDWITLLGLWSIGVGADRRIHQLPIPTHEGVYRCVRDPSTGILCVRTYIRRGTNDHVDDSVKSIVRWRSKLASASGDPLKSFSTLLADSCNYWWRTPYRAH